MTSRALALTILLLLSATLASPLARAAGPEILYIGDSHSVGIFGQSFGKMLRTIPAARVNSFAYVGASPSWYEGHYATKTQYLERDEFGNVSETRYETVTKTDPVTGKTSTKQVPIGGARAVPDLNLLLTTKNPSFVAIELGPNLYFKPSAGAEVRAEARAQIEKMAKEVTTKKIPCFWIGPPDTLAKGSRDDQVAFDRFVSDIVTPLGCTYFHSIDVTTYRPYPGCDGIHYWGKAGMLEACEWAQKAFKEFKQANSLTNADEENKLCAQYGQKN